MHWHASTVLTLEITRAFAFSQAQIQSPCAGSTGMCQATCWDNKEVPFANHTLCPFLACICEHGRPRQFLFPTFALSAQSFHREICLTLLQQTDEREKSFRWVTVPYKGRKEKKPVWTLLITSSFVNSLTWQEACVVPRVALTRVNSFGLFDTNPYEHFCPLTADR